MKRRRMLQAVIGLPFCLAASHARAQARTRARIPRALGYLPWWMAGGWHAMPLNMLDRVVLFDAPILSDGTLRDRAWRRRAPALIEHAGRSGLPLDLALTLLKQNEFERVFRDVSARMRLLEHCERALEQPFVAGLHLDIEGFGEAHSDAVGGFRDWLGALDELRRRLGKDLSAFFPASDEFSPYDPESAKRMDYWVAQLYDAHWVDSKVTGPLVTRAQENPVAVQRALARIAAIGIRSGQVLLSVPLYGWEWPSEGETPGARVRGKASLLTYAETPQPLMPNDRLVATELAREHGLRRDREHTPYYAYRNGNHWVQGWYEDLASLMRKLSPERPHGYAGLAFFPLGYDRGEIIDAMLRWWGAPRN